ncbi:MAG TPA: phage holin family protein [Croceibacterium sp.]
MRDDTDMPEPDADALPEGGLEAEARSLLDDVHALIDDGKTYLEAELGFQKTRAAFVADRAKSTVVYGAIAALLGFLALIGLTVGSIIALTPLLTAWGASAAVVALLLLAAGLAVRAAARKWSSLMQAIAGDRDAVP